MTDAEKQKLAEKLHDYKWKGLPLDEIFSEVETLMAVGTPGSIPEPTFRSTVDVDCRHFDAISRFKYFDELQQIKKDDFIGIAEFSEGKLNYKIFQAFEDVRIDIFSSNLSCILTTIYNNNNNNNQNPLSFMYSGNGVVPWNHYFNKDDFNLGVYMVYRLMWSIKI